MKPQSVEEASESMMLSPLFGGSGRPCCAVNLLLERDLGECSVCLHSCGACGEGQLGRGPWTPTWVAVPCTE